MINQSKTALSVVIVSYNVKDFVLDAIASVYEFISNSVQIIVVDNNSTDDTVLAIRSKFTDVVIIENKTNVGFSAANNQGFDICNGEYILMLNPDAVLVDNSFQEMIVYLKQSNANDRILIGPKLINPDNSTQMSCWKFPSPIQHLLELFFLNIIFDNTVYKTSKLEQETTVDFLSGACMLMSNSNLKRLKGLDVNLFWMDDVDLGKRNIINGGKNIYFPSTIVKHYIGQSSMKNQNIVISNQIISKLKFYKKHNQLFYFYISVPIFFLQIISRIPLFFILGLVKPLNFQKVNAYGYTLSRFFSYLIFGNQKLI